MTLKTEISCSNRTYKKTIARDKKKRWSNCFKAVWMENVLKTESRKNLYEKEFQG